MDDTKKKEKRVIVEVFFTPEQDIRSPCLEHKGWTTISQDRSGKCKRGPQCKLDPPPRQAFMDGRMSAWLCKHPEGRVRGMGMSGEALKGGLAGLSPCSHCPLRSHWPLASSHWTLITHLCKAERSSLPCPWGPLERTGSCVRPSAVTDQQCNCESC